MLDRLEGCQLEQDANCILQPRGLAASLDDSWWMQFLHARGLCLGLLQTCEFI